MCSPSRILYATAFWLTATHPVMAGPTAQPERLRLWEMLQQGGWAMYPLAVCTLAMFALVFYGALETRRRKFVPDTIVQQVGDHLERRDVPAAVQLLRAAPTVLSRALEPALAKAQSARADAGKSSVEETLGELLEHEENSIAQWIQYLNVIATVAPMIGLLGTVSGMIGAFQTISFAGMGRPEMFAGDIGEALITTATGLVIGIPSMIAFFVLRNRLDNAMLHASQSASVLVDRLAGEHLPVEPAAATATTEEWLSGSTGETGSEVS